MKHTNEKNSPLSWTVKMAKGFLKLSQKEDVVEYWLAIILPIHTNSIVVQVQDSYSKLTFGASYYIYSVDFLGCTSLQSYSQPTFWVCLSWTPWWFPLPVFSSSVSSRRPGVSASPPGHLEDSSPSPSWTPHMAGPATSQSSYGCCPYHWNNIDK